MQSLNILLAGDSYSGKTSAAHQLTDETPSVDPCATLKESWYFEATLQETKFMTKFQEIGSYQSLGFFQCPSDVDTIMLFFRMNDPESLENVQDQRTLISVLHPGVPVLVVATKIGTDFTDKSQSKDLSSEISSAELTTFQVTNITDPVSCAETFFKAFSMAATSKLDTELKNDS